jgi:hypothetical protein
MNSVFTLQHLHVFPDGQECNKFIGVYGNEVSAKAAPITHGFISQLVFYHRTL